MSEQVTLAYLLNNLIEDIIDEVELNIEPDGFVQEMGGEEDV